jgi:serine/threonine protein kinase
MPPEQETPTVLSAKPGSQRGEKLDIGQILLRDGVLSQTQLDECLSLQAESAKAGGPPPRLGELLVQKGYATADAISRALNAQSKTILFCPRCNVLLNVDTRPDAVGYSCGRCQGGLEKPPSGIVNKTTDSSVIINSVLPVPPEVLSIRDAPERRFGKYVILEQIGRGGIAEVYRAWDTYLHQYVALKRIQPIPATDQDERHSRVASLLNEAHNAIRLRHPNIVSVYDIGRVGREYYISMEYLDGRTLYDAIAEARDLGRLSPYHSEPARWLDVYFQAAQAVHYAHTRPIPTLHCDLKPGNIFVTKDHRVCVLDFGLARQLGEFHEDVGAIVGTPAYMAPEQATGRDDEIDARTDVYGLGAVLYELLTGRPPFLGTMYEVLRRTVSERPVPPNHVLKLKQGSGEAPRGIPPIPAALESLCLRCLEKTREERPSSALQVAREVEAILQGRSPIAPVAERASTAHVPAVGGEKSPRRVWLAAAVAGVFVAGAAGALLVVGGRDEAGRLREALARFQPELAESMEVSEELRAEAALVGRFKRKLIEAVAERQPEIRDLRFGGRRLERVKVWRARSEVAVLDAGTGPDAAAWADLGAPGLVAIARACGLVENPEQRLGLALACLAMGDEAQGRELLESLRGTPVEAEAVRRLARLPSKG